MVTVAILFHCYLKGNRSSVWLVPGSTDDCEEFPDHIDDYLSHRGIKLATRVSQSEAQDVPGMRWPSFVLSGSRQCKRI